MNRNKFIIALVAVLAVVVAGVTFAIVTTGTAPKGSPVPKPTVSKDYALTEADRTQVKLLSDSFIGSIGTFGWSPDVILNQTNLNLAKTSGSIYGIYSQLSHTTPESAASELNKLTDTTNYGDAVNNAAFGTPFSITTKFTGDLIYPRTVGSKDGYPLIKLTTPIETKLLYIAQDSNFRNQKGELIYGATRLETLTFKGALDLTFTKKPNGWFIDSFNQNVHVFITDKAFTFMDGGFDPGKSVPLTYTIQDINPDGSLGASVDNLAKFNSISRSTVQSGAKTNG